VCSCTFPRWSRYPSPTCSWVWGCTGQKKTWVYVGWVTLFSTLAGLLYGAWVDGVSAWLILLGLGSVLTMLVLVLWLIGQRFHRAAAPTGMVLHSPELDAEEPLAGE